MINLLPRYEQDRLAREYVMRIGVVVLAGIFVLELFALALFAPTYYALYVSTRDLAQDIEDRKKLVPAEDATVAASLATIKKEIAQLQPSEAVVDVPLSLLLEELVRAKTAGLTISAFGYVRGETNPSLQLTGVGATQEDLLGFRRNMQANPRVLDFKYGTSFITTKSNIPFTATINFK